MYHRSTALLAFITIVLLSTLLFYQSSAHAESANNTITISGDNYLILFSSDFTSSQAFSVHWSPDNHNWSTQDIIFNKNNVYIEPPDGTISMKIDSANTLISTSFNPQENGSYSIPQIFPRLIQMTGNNKQLTMIISNVGPIPIPIRWRLQNNIEIEDTLNFYDNTLLVTPPVGAVAIGMNLKGYNFYTQFELTPGGWFQITQVETGPQQQIFLPLIQG